MRKFFTATLWRYACSASQWACGRKASSITVCQGDTVRLHASGADLYEWLPHAGLDDPYSSTPVASPSSYDPL